MIWELGQDKPFSSGQSLLQYVYDEASRVPGFIGGGDVFSFLRRKLRMDEAGMFAMAAAFIGCRLLYLVTTRSPPGHKFAKARPPPPPEEDEASAPPEAQASPREASAEADQDDVQEPPEEEMPEE